MKTLSQNRCCYRVFSSFTPSSILLLSFLLFAMYALMNLGTYLARSLRLVWVLHSLFLNSFLCFESAIIFFSAWTFKQVQLCSKFFLRWPFYPVRSSTFLAFMLHFYLSFLELCLCICYITFSTNLLLCLSVSFLPACLSVSLSFSA